MLPADDDCPRGFGEPMSLSVVTQKPIDLLKHLVPRPKIHDSLAFLAKNRAVLGSIFGLCARPGCRDLKSAHDVAVPVCPTDQTQRDFGGRRCIPNNLRIHVTPGIGASR